MVLNYYSAKPSVARIGAYRRGKHVVFTTFGVKPSEGSLSEHKYEGYGEKFELSALDVKELFKKMDSFYILLASKEEILDLMNIFNSENSVDAWHELRKSQIEAYDQSENINSFLFRGNRCWLDKNTRIGLANMYRLSSKWSDGVTPQLWIDGTPVDIGSPQKAIEVLSRIEQYALHCYSVTQQHLAAVDKAYKTNDIEALKEIDITSGYPDHIILEI